MTRLLALITSTKVPEGVVALILTKLFREIDFLLLPCRDENKYQQRSGSLLAEVHRRCKVPNIMAKDLLWLPKD